MDLAYTYGWRVRDEVLTLARRHVDLEAGTVRLDPGSTKNGEGRVVYLTPALAATVAEQVARMHTLERALGRVIPWLFAHAAEAPTIRKRGRSATGQGIAWRLPPGLADRVQARRLPRDAPT